MEFKGCLSVPRWVCKPMVRRYDLSMLCRVNDGDDDRSGLDAGLNAVSNVESDVGHGLLSFYVDVLGFCSKA